MPINFQLADRRAAEDAREMAAAYALFLDDCERSKREPEDMIWRRTRETYLSRARTSLAAADQVSASAASLPVGGDEDRGQRQDAHRDHASVIDTGRQSLSEDLLIERGPLLNFWVSPIVMQHPHTLEMVTYKGVEWRFQAMKSTCLGTNQLFGHSNAQVIHDAIANAPQASEAKARGKQASISVPNWNQRALAEMFAAVFAKFSQHEDLRRQLVETGDRRLVEHRPDPVWGDNMDGSGQNLHGRVLMAVREFVR